MADGERVQSLFDDIARTAMEPAKANEGDFVYLNRSARPSITLMRQAIDKYFSRFPVSAASEVRQRFRSKDPVGHRSALFEIVLHEVAIRLGCSLALHPDIPGMSTHPDFGVTESSGSTFFLEAIVPGDSPEERSAAKREDEVYALLDQMDLPNFFLHVDIRGTPATPPPISKIREMLREELAKLDPDEVALMPRDRRPRWRFEHEGWALDFSPVPKNEARGKAGLRTLAIKSFGMEVVNPEIPVRRAVEAKAKRYGDLDRPYVIAVNALDFNTSSYDVTEALLGDEVTEDIETLDGYVERHRRDDNGAFGRAARPRNQVVSAVLVFARLRLDTLATCPVRLFHHPWARRPYAGVLTKLPQRQVHERRYVEVDGMTLANLLGLPSKWPSQE